MSQTAGDLRVTSSGVHLSVRQHSAPAAGKPTLILVHGYPDQQDMWDRLIRRLDLDRLHVVTYDVRGAGRSEAPATRDGYRTEVLVDDLITVAEATVPPGASFHLVGHDWGSIQLWDVLARGNDDARLSGRIASFTSISGPSLDHLARLSRQPEGRRLRMLNQSLHSWYVYAFQVPVLPEMLWTLAGRLATRSRRTRWDREVVRNARNGLNLYRANVLGRMRVPGVLHTGVPVQVVHPTGDRFLTEVVLDDLGQACTDLTVVRIDAGHWVPRTHPAEIARLVTEHVRAHQC